MASAITNPSGGIPTGKARTAGNPVASVQSALNTVQKTIHSFAIAKNAIAGPDPAGSVTPTKRGFGLAAMAALMAPVAAIAAPIIARLYGDSRTDRQAKKDKKYMPITLGDANTKIKKSLVFADGQVASATCEKIGDGPTARCTFVSQGKSQSRDINLDDCTTTTCKI